MTGSSEEATNAAGTAEQAAVTTATFLFTDIEGSTRLWEQHPEAMRQALAEHDHLLTDVFRQHEGVVFATAGDSLGVAFSSAEYAVRAAVAAQYALASHDWGVVGAIRVRIGIHTGEAERRKGDYFGLHVSRCARLMSIASGGQIVVSSATRGLAEGTLPSAMELVPRGEHRLKDLSLPEQVFQVTHPSIDSPLTPLRSLSAFAHNLPIQVSSFIGREQEIELLRQRLAESRLVTVTGAGGTGKSRLALQAAAEMIADFRDGVWWVDLAEVQSPGLVPQTVGASMAVHATPEVDMTDAITRHLRDRRVLLVLDNCEHFIEESATLATRLLSSISGLKMLVTSRELLRVDGETAFALGPLPVLPTGAAPAEDAASVQLFIERARAAAPGIRLDAAARVRVGEVCRRLEGLPLAIELAAARLRHMTLEELATRLGDRFRVLTGGSRSGPAHHRTLEATVEWSYDLLTEPEKHIFERLSAFANGFTLEAAEAVAGGGEDDEDVIELLSGLVDKSLLIADREQAGPSRYRMLRTLNEFGASKLAESGDAAETYARHAGYYADMADEVEPHLLDKDSERWTEWLRPEHGNIRTALARCLATRRTALALRLAASLALHWSRSGLLSSGRGWLGRTDASTGDVVATQALEHEIRLAWGEASPAGALEGLAALVRADGDAARAARLLGAADELRRSLDLQALALEKTAQTTEINAARAALGGGAFTAEFERGRQLVTAPGKR